VIAIGILLFLVEAPKLGVQRYGAISIAGKSVATVIDFSTTSGSDYSVRRDTGRILAHLECGRRPSTNDVPARTIGALWILTGLPAR
jgi:hypothetical protein